MLGKEITDPQHVETGGSLKGIGLLDINTELVMQKKTVQVRAHPLHLGPDARCVVEGYEIHMGVTTSAPGILPCFGIVSQGDDSSLSQPFPRKEAREVRSVDGARSSDGRVWGTYIHGVFDQPGYRRQWLNRVRGRKGLGPLDKEISEDVSFRLTQALDRWANHIKQYCDVTKIFTLSGV